MEALVYKIMLLFSIFVVVNCTTEGKKESQTIDGRTIYRMGQKYNKPFLRLVGKAFMDFECRSVGCNEWSAWSSCELFAAKFGMRRRTCLSGVSRTCNANMSPKQEETEVCQDFCPSDYDLSQKGFCLKTYNTTKKSWDDAAASCKSHGGHLININSEEKWNAFVWLMEKYALNTWPHIDGKRKDKNSPWTFSYETDITGYTKWYPNEPTNGSTDLCLWAYHSATSTTDGIGDYACAHTRHYVCEIIPPM